MNPLLWSYPVRLRQDPEKGTRTSFSVLGRSCKCGYICRCGYVSDSYTLSVVQSESGVLFISVDLETHPSVTIHNRADQPLFYGQTLEIDSAKPKGEFINISILKLFITDKCNDVIEEDLSCYIYDVSISRK